MIVSRYFVRFKRTAASQMKFVVIVNNLTEWFNDWSSPPRFGFPEDRLHDVSLRKLTLDHLRGSIERLLAIVQRVHGNHLKAKGTRPPKATTLSAADQYQAMLARLEHTYDPPGPLRSSGLPRHDNDAVDIVDIVVTPTRQELLCDTPPYLPANIPGAPHHHEEGTMQRHLDIHFRLLREELVGVAFPMMCA